MAELQKHTFVLILCGGGGTRLWPQSRENTPKQFVPLFSGQSLFSMTLDRARDITIPENIIISTSQRYLPMVKSLTRGISPENIIGEPIRRDTALAIGVASAYVYQRDPNAVVVNMASDHLISPLKVFSKQVHFAAKLAAKYPYLVTIGIKPRFPHTGMGHIKAYKKWPETDGKFLIGEKFVEKPPLPLAEKYTNSGHYFWNTNLFVFRASLMLDLLKKYQPKVYSLLPRLIKDIGTSKENETLNLAFQMSPGMAIDYAVAEKLRKFICIPAEFHWTDVGDWSEVYNNLPKDLEGNVIEGPHGIGKYIGLNSKNNLLFLDKKIVATVGLQDMLIIDTPDALLICPKDEAQGVKQIVQALKDNNLVEYL